uniref:Putative ovule protein n=1 Tax=Solanum chacoense TaxID=4108 RepID=A0A0V0HZH8_SOLCH
MFSAVSIGPELRPKLINISSLVLKEVAHILNCEFAHEAPSNSSICDPSRTHVLGCQHWARAATQSDKHTFLGAQLDHTTRGIKERTYSWSLVSNTGLG